MTSDKEEGDKLGDRFQNRVGREGEGDGKKAVPMWAPKPQNKDRSRKKTDEADL